MASKYSERNTQRFLEKAEYLLEIHIFTPFILWRFVDQHTTIQTTTVHPIDVFHSILLVWQL